MTMKLFLFPGVMGGCYTGGVAFAIAETKDDAIKQLSDQLAKFLKNEPTNLPVDDGTWRSNADFSDPIEIEKIRSIFDRVDMKNPCQKAYDSLTDEEKLIYNRETEKIRGIFNHVPREAVDYDDPVFKAKEHKLMIACFEKELRNCKCVEKPLTEPLAFFQGGGD
jgi:hypothetical protein